MPRSFPLAPSAPSAPPAVGVGAVVAADDGERERAVALAARLGVPVASAAAWRGGAGGAVVLWVAGDGLALRGPAVAGAGAVRPAPPPDGGRAGREPLLRAVGPWPDVIDATAGWAGDAGVLAAAGRRVVLFERHPVLALLLEDALARWRAAGIEAAARLELVVGDARALLATRRADVVLLDPMYPERGGRARKGEDLTLARRVVGDDADQAELLEVARRAARRRVVVKRPRAAPPLAGRAPSGALVGRTTRYDLYPPSEAPT